MPVSDRKFIYPLHLSCMFQYNMNATAQIFSVNIASALQGDFALAQLPLFIPFLCSPFLTVIHDKLRAEKFHGYPSQQTTAGFGSNKYCAHQSILTTHDFIDPGYWPLKLLFIFGFKQNQIPNF